MMNVEISNEQNCLEIDESVLRDRTIRSLHAERVVHAEITIALVDDAVIHTVNREHLQHDYPTDVISFLYHADSTPNGRSLEGEIVISVETAVREAARFGWQPHDEVTLYLVHGLLHLCGYDDLSEPEQQQMRGREQAILQFWNLTPHYGESIPSAES